MLPIGLFIPLLFITIRFVTAVQLNVQVRATDEVFFGLAENRSAADINFVVLPLAVGLTTMLLALLAFPLGPLLRSMPPLRAYTIDIVGSLSGIAAFTLLSAVSSSPAVWFAVLGLILLCLAMGRGSTRGGQSWPPHGRRDHLRLLPVLAASANTGRPTTGLRTSASTTRSTARSLST